MINIPININAGTSTQNVFTSQSFGVSDVNSGFNGLMSLNNKVNSSECKSISLTENTSTEESSISIDELKDLISSLEEFISDLTIENEDIELNEDISFLQAIIPLIIQNEELLNSTDNNNLNQLVDLISNKLNESAHEISSESNDLALEFIKHIDSDFIKKFEKLETLQLKFEKLETLQLKFEKLETLQLKKEALAESFQEFLGSKSTESEIDDIGINGFYNIFKTMSDSSNKTTMNLNDTAIDSIESLDASDMIELLNHMNDSSKTMETSQSDKSINTNTFVLNQETLSEDLYSTIIHMKNINLKQLKLKLSPKELGDMTIDVSQLDNVSKIILTVSNQDTLNIIKSNLKEILEHLKSSGLISSESSITVQAEGPKKDSFSEFNGFYSNEKKQNKNSLADSATNTDSLSGTEDVQIKTNSRILNILA